jgi:NTE family protein
VSPYAYPDLAGTAFTDLLTRHVDVDRLARLQESPPADQPLLLIGAVDVLSGDFRAFSSRRGERAANAWLVGLARLEGRVALPTVSPYAYPDLAGTAFTDLLTRHVDVDRLARLQESPPADQPLLLVGAVDVLSGDFRAFSSRRGEITVNAVLASAAVPLLFRAVEERGRYYWDGLFSQNPPVRELPDARPEEIWVVRINPRARATEPKSVGDIADRRNELAGNLSLEQELYVIRKVNEWADRLGDPYRRIEIREITLDLDLGLPSKLDRRPAFLRRLFDAGREQADAFLAGLPG